MSAFHSFEFDKDKIYACHLSSDEEVAKIYHFKSSIQRRDRTTVRRGSPDLKDEVESCSPVSSQQVFSQRLPDKECTLSKKIENEKRLLSSSVSFSSCVTSFCDNNKCDKVGDDEENEINEENDLSTTLKRGTKRKIDEVVGSETILPPSKREKIQVNSKFDSNILAPQKISNSNINRDMSLGSMVVKDTQLPKTSSSICEVSLEGNGAGFMNNSVSNPQPMSQTSMNSFVSPRRITLNFPSSQTTNSSPSSSSISSFPWCSSTKLSTCCSSSLVSSYSSPSSLSSSVLLQRKSQGEMETGENNFLSQTQFFRQYIFAGSLSEYPEERKELQFSTSPSTSGFVV
jgi:hypothetical protein